MHKHHRFANNVSVSALQSNRRKVNFYMSKTLYVGNLPWSTTDVNLSETFQAHGHVVSSRVITDKETGRSRGFGFVEVDNDDTEKIVTAMNGTDFGGRQLVVNEAKPREHM